MRVFVALSVLAAFALSGCATRARQAGASPFECTMTLHEVGRALQDLPSTYEVDLNRQGLAISYATDGQTVFGFAPSALTLHRDEYDNVTLRAIIRVDLSIAAGAIVQAPARLDCDHSGSRCLAWHGRSMRVAEDRNAHATLIDCLYEFGQY